MGYLNIALHNLILVLKDNLRLLHERMKTSTLLFVFTLQS